MNDTTDPLELTDEEAMDLYEYEYGEDDYDEPDVDELTEWMDFDPDC